MTPRVLTILFAISAAAPGVASAEKRPMRFEDVVEVRRVSDPQVSPDGRQVLYVVERRDLEKNEVSRHVWRFERESGEARALTAVGQHNDSPRWAPDGESFAFLTDRGGSKQVAVMRRDGGEATPLTDHATDVQAFWWSPDGTRIAFTAVDPKSEARRRAEEQGRDARVFETAFELPKLWTLEVSTRKERQVLAQELNVEEVAWSPDGERLAFRARETTLFDRLFRAEIYTLAASGGDPERLTDNGTPESGLVWSRDGRFVFYTAPDRERFVNAEARLFRLEVATREIARLGAEHGYGFRNLHPSPDGRRLYFLSGVRTDVALFALDLESGAVERIGPQKGTLTGYDVSDDGGTLAWVFSDSTRLPELWTSATRPLRPEPAVRMNPQLDEWSLGETRVIQWRSEDGWEVEGLLTLPVGHVPGRPVPTVVLIHGGPELAFTDAFEPSFMDYTQVLAGRGWAVLKPNYRGGTNYGDRFLQGMNRDAGGGDYRDIMAGVDHVIGMGVADPERLAVMGWSWGGISTGWIVTHTDRFAAASAGAMVSNHFSVFGEADLTFDVELFYVGGSPWEDPARYLSMSPIGHVLEATTPTLLLHGLEDVRCPFPQSVEFYRGLKSAGVETRLVAYPREPHLFQEPQHWLDKMQRELAWFEEHVGVARAVD